MKTHRISGSRGVRLHAVEMGVPLDLRGHGLPIVVDRHKAAMPHAQIHVMEKCGHAPFWENAGELNRRLRVFAEGL